MFIVGVYYSFDQEMPMYIWDKEDMATDFIKTDSERETKISNDEGGTKVASYQHSDDYSWAKVEFEDGEFIEWNIGSVQDMRKGALKNLCRQMRSIIFYTHEEMINGRSIKETHRVVLADRLSDQQKELIKGCMKDEQFFIPRQVGLPEVMLTPFSHGWWTIDNIEDTMDTVGTVICTPDELVEMFHKAKGNWVDWTADPMEKAKFLINQYCLQEFEAEADFTNLEKIGVGATDDPCIECFVNLVDYSFTRYVDGYLVYKEQYEDLVEMTNVLLLNLEYESLVFADDVV